MKKGDFIIVMLAIFLGVLGALLFWSVIVKNQLAASASSSPAASILGAL
jgi:hypothetical protein